MTRKTVLNAPSAFHVMIQPKGAVCNLDCQYCYFLSKEKLYPDSSFHMQEELLEMYTRQFIGAHQVPQATFAWQGGEPTLMGLDFFKKAVAFQQKHKKPGMQILNTIQTNGTLLDEEWCQFFKEHNFLVGISMDGPESLHNAYRKDKKGFRDRPECHPPETRSPSHHPVRKWPLFSSTNGWTSALFLKKLIIWGKQISDVCFQELVQLL